MLSHQRKAITSIEYSFMLEINGSIRESRYARSGEMEYSAQVTQSDRGKVVMPFEFAWDGQKKYIRHTLGILLETLDESLSRGIVTPDDAVGKGIETCLGLRPSDDNDYRFVSARKTKDGDSESIELEFRSDATANTFSTTHRRREGYWPIHAKLTNGQGVVTWEIKDVRYATLETEGNKIFFPVQVSTVTTSPAGRSNGSSNQNWVVQQNTLRVNHPIPPNRFSLKPWPNEVVLDQVKGKTVQPVDPNWSASGEVEFPWDEIAVLAEQSRAKRNDVPLTPSEVVAQAKAPAIETFIPRALMLLGAIAVIAGAVAVYRKRRGA